MSSKARQPNALERKVHQAGAAAPNNILSQKDLESLIPDPNTRLEAVNFLIHTGLLKVLQDAKQNTSFKAVLKEELKIKKEIGGEETMVLSQISAAGNEGIWTKHLKAKTELHQTVINRCLKALEQKQLIKSIKSVKHPTRKIYMIFNLEPSVEVTGGPWYTDNELDTEFIKMLTSACLQYVRERTIPRGSINAPPEERKLYARSSAPPCPSAEQVMFFLQKSRITNTELALEHVEMLLDVLVYDGLIERLPGSGAHLWTFPAEDDTEDLSYDLKKRPKPDSDSEHNTDILETTSPRKKAKTSKVAQSPTTATPSGSSKKRARRSSDVGESSSLLDGKRARHGSPDTDENLEDEEVTASHSVAQELKPTMVYRALFPDKSRVPGWAESPCSQCRQFEFCEAGSGLVVPGVVELEEGPVNPRNCTYFTDWLPREYVAR